MLKIMVKLILFNSGCSLQSKWFFIGYYLRLLTVILFHFSEHKKRIEKDILNFQNLQNIFAKFLLETTFFRNILVP